MSDMTSGQLTSIQELRNLVENTFPQEELVYAFGYGSGVFSQQLDLANPSQDNLVDLILVVRDSYNFHRDNLRSNPQHYTSHLFASDPAARITWWQRHKVETRFFRNPRVYFNVTDGLKYGVVQEVDLITDLKDWQYLYLAGRMHKPTVQILNRLTSSHLAQDSVEYYQQTHNLPAALSAALLLQSQHQPQGTISPTQVFTQIAALSYTGDFRTAIGAEDPHKITKLVSAPGQLQRFHALYQQSVESLTTKGILQASSAEETWAFDTNPAALDHLQANLPSHLRYSSNLQAALAQTVAPSARYQSVKGLATAGLSRSVAYAARKLSKGVLRFMK